MTAEQLTVIREALEVSYDILKRPLRGVAFEHDRLGMIAKLEKALDELGEVLADPAAELQMCDRCKKVFLYNGDWYCGLCPKCADETDDSEGV